MVSLNMGCNVGFWWWGGGEDNRIFLEFLSGRFIRSVRKSGCGLGSGGRRESGFTSSACGGVEGMKNRHIGTFFFQFFRINRNVVFPANFHSSLPQSSIEKLRWPDKTSRPSPSFPPPPSEVYLYTHAPNSLTHQKVDIRQVVDGQGKGVRLISRLQVLWPSWIALLGYRKLLKTRFPWKRKNALEWGGKSNFGTIKMIP